MNALQKLPPAWHAEAKELLNANFDKIHLAFTDATKRAVWMGMFLNHIKAKGKEDGSIPHGQFGPWLEKNAAEIPYRTLHTYMQLAVGICEKGKFEICQFSTFAQTGELPPKIEKMIEGQSQQQLFLEYKNVDANGNPLKAGCAQGRRKPVDLTLDDAEETGDVADIRADIVMLADDDSDLKKASTANLLRLKTALKVLDLRIDDLLKTRKKTA